MSAISQSRREGGKKKERRKYSRAEVFSLLERKEKTSPGLLRLLPRYDTSSRIKTSTNFGYGHRSTCHLVRGWIQSGSNASSLRSASTAIQYELSSTTELVMYLLINF